MNERMLIQNLAVLCFVEASLVLSTSKLAGYKLSEHASPCHFTHFATSHLSCHFYIMRSDLSRSPSPAEIPLEIPNFWNSEDDDKVTHGTVKHCFDAAIHEAMTTYIQERYSLDDYAGMNPPHHIQVVDLSPFTAGPDDLLTSRVSLLVSPKNATLETTPEDVWTRVWPKHFSVNAEGECYVTSCLATTLASLLTDPFAGLDTTLPTMWSKEKSVGWIFDDCDQKEIDRTKRIIRHVNLVLGTQSDVGDYLFGANPPKFTPGEEVSLVAKNDWWDESLEIESPDINLKSDVHYRI